VFFRATVGVCEDALLASCVCRRPIRRSDGCVNGDGDGDGDGEGKGGHTFMVRVGEVIVRRKVGGFGFFVLKAVYAESLVDGERPRHLAGNPG